MMDSTRTLALATEPRALTSDQKKAADAAFRGLPCDPKWPATARAVYDGLVTALQGKTVQDPTHECVPSEPHYTLGYGMRMDKGTAPEPAHAQVSVTLPDGSEGSMALHVINGTPDEIKARLLESVDAFFDIHCEA
jgi:hypothetical protein